MWVIFEGLDKAGKGTLKRSFLKATNYKHIVVDRGPVGYLVFDEVFGRKTKTTDQAFIHQARKAMKSGEVFVVYCKAPVDVAMARLEEHGETCPYNYEKAQKLLDKQIDRYYKSEYVFELNTNQSIEECTRQIVERFNETFRLM